MTTPADPAGPTLPVVGLRPETDADAPFLAALFAAGARATLAAAALPEATLAHLVDMQHRAQRQAYAALHPAARRWIVLCDGSAAGRLMEADTPGALHIVDIAVVPAAQRRGVATAAVWTLMAEAARQGVGVSAEVAVANLASRTLFARLGFAETAASGAAHLRVGWRPPPSQAR